MNLDRLMKKLFKDVKSKVSSGFGFRNNPLTKLKELHNGVDFPLVEGTPIYSPYDAEVISVYYNDLGGKQVILQHPNGYRTGYAHLNATNRLVGEMITEGTLVGVSGKTGKVTGPHLHFTLTNSKGEKCDPLLYSWN